MLGNKGLRKANREKKDEFYTQLTDIEKELRFYKEHLKGKVIFCNCDDPKYSNFWKFFELNFKHLGLKLNMIKNLLLLEMLMQLLIKKHFL